jgi:hypothetical protein
VEPSGAFGGLVPLQPGKNRIRIVATAGRQRAESERIVHYAPGSVAVWEVPEREILPVPTVTGRRELDLSAGQRRELDLGVGGGQQRKEIEIGVVVRRRR